MDLCQIQEEPPVCCLKDLIVSLHLFFWGDLCSIYLFLLFPLPPTGLTFIVCHKRFRAAKHRWLTGHSKQASVQKSCRPVCNLGGQNVSRPLTWIWSTGLQDFWGLKSLIFTALLPRDHFQNTFTPNKERFELTIETNQSDKAVLCVCTEEKTTNPLKRFRYLDWNQWKAADGTRWTWKCWEKF